MATATRKTSFGVTCPHYHDTDATLAIDLGDIQTITCSGCDETFSPHQARDMAADADPARPGRGANAVRRL